MDINHELEQKLSIAKDLFEAIPSGIIMLDDSFSVRYFNRSFVSNFFNKMTFKKLERVIKTEGYKFADIVDFEDLNGEKVNHFLKDIPGSRKNGVTIDQINLVNRLDNSKYLVIMTFVPVYSNDSQDKQIGSMFFINNMSDYYSIHDKYDQTKDESMRDALTHIFNKRHLYTFLNNQIEKISNSSDYFFSIVMIDIDNFKNLNDKYGHLVGDHILKVLANKMKSRIRKDDIAARFGGEEFILVLSNTNEMNSIIVAERLRESLNQEDFSCLGVPYPVTISLGIFCLNKNCPTDLEEQVIDKIISFSDQAMYYSKNTGKNRTSVYYDGNIYTKDDFTKLFKEGLI